MDGVPQLAHGVFLTDSGLETDLIFHHGYDLPSFAAFVLLEDEAGRERLRRYYREHAAVAGDVGVGFVAGGAHVAGQRQLRSGLQDVVRTWIRSPPRVTRGG